MSYEDTENEMPGSHSTPWVTLEWGIGFVDRITYCGEKVEEASFNVVFLGKPGVGDLDLIKDAEAVMATFMAKVDATGALQLTAQGFMETFSDRHDYFCVSFPVEYRYQT
jgi:hypothetical protein